MLNAIPEWEGFSNPQINPAYSKIFRMSGYHKPEDMGNRLISQINRINDIYKKYGGWEKFVRKYASDMPKDDAREVVKMLTSRIKLLNRKIEHSI